jgi:hypothetical protein
MQPTETMPPEIREVQFTEDRLTFALQDGRTVSVPLAWYPTLMLATPAERADFELNHGSVYWPALDCDLSSACLLRGAKEDRRYARRAFERAQLRASAPVTA